MMVSNRTDSEGGGGNACKYLNVYCPVPLSSSIVRRMERQKPDDQDCQLEETTAFQWLVFGWIAVLNAAAHSCGAGETLPDRS